MNTVKSLTLSVNLDTFAKVLTGIKKVEFVEISKYNVHQHFHYLYDGKIYLTLKELSDSGELKKLDSGYSSEFLIDMVPIEYETLLLVGIIDKNDLTDIEKPFVRVQNTEAGKMNKFDGFGNKLTCKYNGTIYIMYDIYYKLGEVLEFGYL